MPASAAQQATLVATATAFTAIGLGIALLQSDTVGRKILSVEQLTKKRNAEYRYKWAKQLEKQMYIAMDILGGDTALHILTTDEEIDDLLTKMTNTSIKNGNDARILGIALDERDPRQVPEYQVYISSQQVIYQLPLRQFGMRLADTMERQLTATALCFVADASSGLGLDIIADFLTKTGANVPVIREPLWMAQFAYLVEKDILPQDKLERILFGLVRLEALRVNDAVGPLRTVAFTVPQTTVPSLLPLLQKVFSEERHVFCYQGCRASVGRMVHQQHEKEQTGRIFRLNSNLLYTTPLYTSLTKAVPALPPALAKLPISLASTTEAWMASVDTFTKLKEEEKTNNYLPFVCKLGFLVNNASMDEGTERFYALSSLLQFMTGSRTRPLDDVVVGMAKSILQNITGNIVLPSFPPKTIKSIEDCVFRHKGILLGEKTLKDTVLPTKHWTLKASVKGGCSCCAPEEIDEDELKYLKSQKGIIDDEHMIKPKYVDGKTTFAFDPSKFS